MATELQITDRAIEETQLAERLDELETLLEKSENMRRRHTMAVIIFFMTILIVLTLFIIHLVSFFKTYPKQTLMRQVFQHSRAVLYSHAASRQYKTFDPEIIGFVKKEMTQAVKKQANPIRFETKKAIKDLNRYMMDDLKRDFQNELNIRLMAETRKYLADKKYQSDKQTMNELQELNAALSAMITERMFQYWEANRYRNGDLQKEIALLRKSEKYQRIEKMPLSIAEKKLWENLLDCWICQANEIKGMSRVEEGE